MPHVIYENISSILSKDSYICQDDFMDCYGNPEKSGKKGTDIQEGKCTWLVVMAMKKANHSQIETLNQCYSSKDPEAITTVLNVFEELNLKDIYLPKFCGRICQSYTKKHHAKHQ